MATGISSASAPTLFIHAERKAPATHSPAISTSGCLAWRSSGPATTSTAPERASPWLITSTAATVITALLPKPLKASSGFTSPSSTEASSAPSATRS